MLLQFIIMAAAALTIFFATKDWKLLSFIAHLIILINATILATNWYIIDRDRWWIWAGIVTADILIVVSNYAKAIRR